MPNTADQYPSCPICESPRLRLSEDHHTFSCLSCGHDFHETGADWHDEQLVLPAESAAMQRDPADTADERWDDAPTHRDPL